MVLPNGLAQLGHAIEHRMAPPIYRRSQIVTLSSSSKNEIVERLRIPPERVTVSPPGVEPAFSPGGERSEAPLVVAVGRLVPVKRFELLIDGLVRLKARHPELRAVIVGEGYERPRLEALIAGHGAGGWISLPGYVPDDELISLYRQAWVVASTSLREGWGMTVTEAGACGTPSVVTRISGHEDAVVHGRSGLLVDDRDGLVAALDTTLADEVARQAPGHRGPGTRRAVHLGCHSPSHVGRARRRVARSPGPVDARSPRPVRALIAQARRGAQSARPVDREAPPVPDGTGALGGSDGSTGPMPGPRLRV